MKMLRMPGSGTEVSSIVLGCMHFADQLDRPGMESEASSVLTARLAMESALDSGINAFDLADIYAGGKAESIFAEVCGELGIQRESIFVQSKCGIRKADDGRSIPSHVDSSPKYLVETVDKMLERLQTDYLDLLLLHRPDILMEPRKLADAVEILRCTGRIRHFGVSNHNATQMSLMKSRMRVPIVANQVQINLLHTSLFDELYEFNEADICLSNSGQGTLGYCMEHGIILQAWAPLVRGSLGGELPPRGCDRRVRELHSLVARMASGKGILPETLLIAWLLRHPARIQPVTGTLHPDRIRACCEATEVVLSRDEWYQLYVAGRGKPIL